MSKHLPKRYFQKVFNLVAIGLFWYIVLLIFVVFYPDSLESFFNGNPLSMVLSVIIPAFISMFIYVIYELFVKPFDCKKYGEKRNERR